jgi:beta-xylosidase
VIAVWNYAAPDKSGEPETMTLRFKGAKLKRASISRVDGEHGDVQAAYEKMGAPSFPTQAQITALRKAAELPAAEVRDLRNGELTVTLPAHGLAVIEVK